MKKIILLGDSTREGYDKYVREQLDGVAEVLFPQENCQFALYLFRHLQDWQRNGSWGNDADLVHWNAGLWDALHLLRQEPLSDPEDYAKTIRRIDSRIRFMFPKAKVVFATNTLGIDERYDSDINYRLNAEIEEYNRYALAALEGTGTIIDDLCEVSRTMPREYYIDAVHMYEPEGRRRMGEAVLSCVCPLVGIEKQGDGKWVDTEKEL